MPNFPLVYLDASLTLDHLTTCHIIHIIRKLYKSTSRSARLLRSHRRARHANLADISEKMHTKFRCASSRSGRGAIEETMPAEPVSVQQAKNKSLLLNKPLEVSGTYRIKEMTALVDRHRRRLMKAHPVGIHDEMAPWCRPDMKKYFKLGEKKSYRRASPSISEIKVCPGGLSD